jgi:hypothetical protein
MSTPGCAFAIEDGTFNGWHLDVADVFPTVSKDYSVTFDSTWSDVEAAANGWVDETGRTVPWTLLMTNVFHPEIRLLLGDDASALAYIDNVALRSIPNPPPRAARLRPSRTRLRTSAHAVARILRCRGRSDVRKSAASETLLLPQLITPR